MLVRIQGVAVVFDDADELVTDADVLCRFDGYMYDDERFTDYLGGPPEEDALQRALHPGGHLRFSLDHDAPLLTAVTEYSASRKLTEGEMKLLLDYTMGQWADGIGENLATETGIKLGLSLQCQTSDPVPSVVQLEVES